ncbi:MAG: redox-regulated ATPase YchF [Anaerolineae bacterium]|nr:redox-regulated ATPase YchF [Anaerolineae bacterium]
MKIVRLGIIGLPSSGKTTVFNALTGANLPTGQMAGGLMEIHEATVNVPEPRLDVLHKLYNPRKKVYAQVTYSDIGGLDKGIGEGGLSGPLRNALAQVDGFLHVVRAFENPNVPHLYGSVDPARDLGILDGEFLLGDLIAVERRLERLEQDKHKIPPAEKPAHTREVALFERLHAHLETERPLRDMEQDFTDEETKLMRGYGFFSLKPVLVVLNTDAPGAPELHYPHKRGAVAAMQAQIEAEIAQLDPDEAALFRGEYGIETPAADRIIRLSYQLLGLHAFFTVGDDEVRAWTLPVGATAIEAAGTIHTDFARGFIRASVTPHEDLVAAAGKFAETRASGKTRLEGRDYVVRDGDVIEFRFNV